MEQMNFPQVELELLNDRKFSEIECERKKSNDIIKKEKGKLKETYWGCGIPVLGFLLLVIISSNLTGVACILVPVFWIIGKFLDSKTDTEGKKAFATFKKKEEERISRVVEEINAKYQRMYDEYLAKFEKAVQEESTKYFGSENIEKIKAWFISNFENLLNEADRRTHIASVVINISSYVYPNKIDGSIGKFDFETNRCSALISPVQQAALAKAIASALQVELMTSYSTDPSGTEAIVKIDSDFSNPPMMTITYNAPNGNYEELKSW